MTPPIFISYRRAESESEVARIQGELEAIYGGITERLVELDWVMVSVAIALALVSSVLAGLYPTWRACSIAPAAHLKAQ